MKRRKIQRTRISEKDPGEKRDKDSEGKGRKNNDPKNKDVENSYIDAKDLQRSRKQILTARIWNRIQDSLWPTSRPTLDIPNLATPDLSYA
jgi:hypothetical protein